MGGRGNHRFFGRHPAAKRDSIALPRTCTED
jgi:hypothetical protein